MKLICGPIKMIDYQWNGQQKVFFSLKFRECTQVSLEFTVQLWNVDSYQEFQGKFTESEIQSLLAKPDPG